MATEGMLQSRRDARRKHRRALLNSLGQVFDFAPEAPSVPRKTLPVHFCVNDALRTDYYQVGKDLKQSLVKSLGQDTYILIFDSKELERR